MYLIKNILLGVFLLYSMVASAQKQEVIYVSVNGDDSSPGNINKPKLTLANAIQSVNESNAKSAIIYIRAGTYPLKNTVVINNFKNLKNLIITNYQNEKVLISGGVKIENKDVKKTLNTTVLSRLPNSANGHIYEVDLKKIGISDYGTLIQHGHRNAVTAPLELYCDDYAMDLARWPNTDYLPIGKVIESGITNKKIASEQGGAVFKYTSDRPKLWKPSDEIWIAGFLANGFANDNVRIKTLDAENGQITLSTPSSYGVKSTREILRGQERISNFRRFYFYNVLEELDTPGEWYLDRVKGVLYFYPIADKMPLEIFISMLSRPLISLINANGVTIKGIQIGNGRDVGIYAQNTKNIHIEYCIIKNQGTIGISIGKNTSDKKLFKSYEELISFDKTSGFQIKACKIFNTGTGGVFLTGGYRQNLAVGNNSVQNTEILNYARRNLVSCPAVFLGGVGNKIVNCYIHDSEGQGIMYWGNDHEISFNKIKSVASEINDQGAVYTGRDPSSTGTIIHDNLFTDIVSKRGYSVTAVYIDDGSGGIKLENNIFNNCGTSGQMKFGAIHINGGGDNIFTNNYFFDCGSVVSRTAWTKEKWQTVLNTDEMKQKLSKYVQINSPVFLMRYPYLKRFIHSDIIPGDNTFINNLISNTPVFANNIKSVVQKNTIKSNIKFSSFVGLNSIRDKNSRLQLGGIAIIDISKIGLLR